MDIFHHKYVLKTQHPIRFVADWAVAGLVLQGIGLDHDLTLCTAGIYVCVTLYGLAKAFVYLFLCAYALYRCAVLCVCSLAFSAAERAYVVWCPTLAVPRYKSAVYLACGTAVVLYTGVICHLFIGVYHR